MSALEAAADAAKQVANDAFKKGDYKLAVKKYGVALKLAYELPEPKYPGKLQSTRSAQLLANRCMAHLALGDERSALTDAEQALRAAPDWPKAHFRHGTVLMRLKNYTKAYAAFKQGYHLDPTNEELTAACQQAHQKMVGLEAPKDKLLTAEELVVMRAQKVEEERRQRATLAEGRRSAAVAAATGRTVTAGAGAPA
jgi:tetratricopeptide (TPR) repeat protein